MFHIFKATCVLLLHNFQVNQNKFQYKNNFPYSYNDLKKKKKKVKKVCVNPELKRQRQENCCKFETKLVYMVGSGPESAHDKTLGKTKVLNSYTSKCYPFLSRIF